MSVGRNGLTENIGTSAGLIRSGPKPASIHIGDAESVPIGYGCGR